MTINRNNYEEFFLLYVDNELSVLEKNAIDVFLNENPDLQEELLMLQQSILMPETFVFADKENLFKQETIDSDMQEQLLLMLDSELDKKAKEKLTDLIKRDASIKQEWEILQQTKLPAEDKIIFEDKAVLYKKEGGRVIVMNWRRIAAAAVIIGFGVWGVLNYSNKSNSIQPDTQTVKNNSVNPQTTPIIPDSKNEQPASADKSSSINSAIAVNEIKQEAKAKPALPGKIKKPVGTDNKQKRAVPQQSNNNDVAEQKINKIAPSNNLPKPSLENFNSTPGNNIEDATVTHTDNNNSSNKVNDVVQPAETIPTNSLAVQTIYLTDNENEDENKNRKNKIGGFLKKIKRVVERKTNMKSSGDNSIRIANMSFAMQ